MAFVIKKKDSFFWPVTLKEPADGGSYSEQKIDLEFKKLKESELKELLSKTEGDKEFCKAIVLGWKDVKDESGFSVEFTQDSFEALLDNVKFASSICNQYLKICSGVVEKN